MDTLAFNRQLVLDHIKLSWIRAEYAIANFMLHPDFHYSDSFNHDSKNKLQYVEYVRSIRDAVSNLDIITDEVVAEDDKVMCLCCFFGSVEHEIFGFAPSDQILGIPFASFWEIQDRKIFRIHNVYDADYLKAQLGNRVSIAEKQRLLDTQSPEP